MLFFFFFNDTATTEIYTLSLHDALPICAAQGSERLPSVGGFPRDHAGGEDHVRVLGVDLHLGEVVGALRDALVRAGAGPALARVVRSVKASADLGGDGREHAPRRGGRDADADPA